MKAVVNSSNKQELAVLVAELHQHIAHFISNHPEYSYNISMNIKKGKAEILLWKHLNINGYEDKD